jgi:hypothetical protein
MKFLNHSAMIACIASISVMLAACDGSLNFSDEGSVKNATIESIVRGLAQDHEQINEDENITNNRRTMLVMGASQVISDIKKNFPDALRSNPNFKNINVTGQRLLPKNSDNETINKVNVTFDVQGGYQANIEFLVPEKVLIGPIRLNRLPILTDIYIIRDKISFKLFDDKAAILIGLLSTDKDLFKNKIDLQWLQIQNQENAKAEKLKMCDQLANQKPVFVPYPFATDSQNSEELRKFNDSIASKMQFCENK